MHANGYCVELDLDGNELKATGTNKIGRGALGAPERTFDLTQVSAIAYKGANPLKNGTITIVDERGKSLIHFRRKSNAEMEAMYSAISERVPAGAEGASTKATLTNEGRDAWAEQKRAELEAKHSS